MSWLQGLRPARRRMSVRAGVAHALACGAVLAVADATGLFAGLDQRLGDIRFKLRGTRPGSDAIALVEVDDATIAAFDRRWPLERSYYALLVQALHDAGAAAIGVDVLFFGPSPHDPRFDALLAAVSARTPRVVHSFVFPLGTAPDGGALPAEGDLVRLRPHGIPVVGNPLGENALVSLPFPELLAGAPGLGHTDVAIDSDGLVRRLPLFEQLEDRVYPALAVRLVAMARDSGALPAVRFERTRTHIRWADGDETAAPRDREGATAIAYTGGREAFHRTYSMSKVLGWYRIARDTTAGGEARGVEARRALEAAFRGRIVLVGTTAQGEAATDLGATPLSQTTPLVYVHANAVDALLRERFLRRPAPPLAVALLAALCVPLGAAFAALELPVAAAAMAGFVILAAFAAYALFAWAGIDGQTTVLLLLAPLAYALIASRRYVFLERRSQEGEKDLDAARTIQKRLLPEAPPEVAGLDLFGTNIPAREIGGDYFDFVRRRDGALVVALGDVSGKGVPAALLMSHLQASLHAELQTQGGPGSVVRAMDALLYRSTEIGRFATFFLGVIDRQHATLRYSNAGHNPALLIRNGVDGATPEVEMLGATGVPLGMFEGTAFGEETRSWNVGDVLVLYSDGITEAARGTQLYGEDRLVALVQRLLPQRPTAAELGDAILADVRTFAGAGIHGDDVTLLVAIATGGAAAVGN